MGSLDYIYQKLDDFDWVANDFQYKSDLNYIFDLSSPKLPQILNIGRTAISYFLCGLVCVKSRGF